MVHLDYEGHRQRLREKYKKTGIDTMADYEMLELLLTYAIPRKDVKSLAKRLMNKFKTIANIVDTDLIELEEVEGVGESTGILLNVIKDFITLYFRDKAVKRNYITSPEDVINFSKSKIGDKKKEHIMILYLNTKNAIIDYDIMSSNEINFSTLSPRTLVEVSLKHKTNGIIIVHNHPSGDVTPSESDKLFTKKMQDASQLFSIRFLDHIIVSRTHYFSFLKENIL